MNRHLYKGFSSDASAFSAAREFWATSINDLVVGAHQVGQWVPWLSYDQTRSNTPEEGPIFSTHSTRQKKALVLQQYEPTTDNMVVSARIDIFGEGYLEDPIPYLLISCELSSLSAEAAKRLIAAWIQPDMTKEGMELEIERIVTPAPPES